MKKKFYLCMILLALACVSMKAQVTIGADAVPDPDALLDLKQNVLNSTSTKGVLMPRMELQSKDNPAPLNDFVKGMIVYNTATAGADNKKVTPGFYYSDGSEWKKLPYMDEGNWFFLPPTAIDVTQDVTGGQINLYTIFRDNMILPKSYAVKNPDAPAAVSLNVHQATDLSYYVTDYDQTVFSGLSIDNNGILTYSVDAGNVTDQTFITIVLRVK